MSGTKNSRTTYDSFDQWNSKFFPARRDQEKFSDKNIDEIAICLAESSVDRIIKQHSHSHSANNAISRR